MKNIIKQLLAILSPEERKKLLPLFICILTMSLLEVVGVVSIMPFIAVVAKQNLIFENKILAGFYTASHSSSPTMFIVILGVIVLVVMVVSNLFSAFTTSYLMYFGFKCNHSIARRLLSGYLNQQYAFFLNINSAALSKNILAEVGRVITGLLNPMLVAIARLISSLCIIALLLYIDPLIALVATAILGGSYTLVYFLVKKILKHNGEAYLTASERLYRSAAESFGGIKDIKLLGKEEAFIERFSVPSLLIARYHTVGAVVPLLPKYALEIIAFGGVVVIIIIYLLAGRNVNDILPLITLYAVAGYRLMPALQYVFSGFSQVKFYQPSLELISRDLKAFKPPEQELGKIRSAPIALNGCLHLQEVSFAYPNSAGVVIHNITLRIEANTTVAIVGESGSGKTTTVDIILGLLRHQNGRMLVDGVEITDENVRAWQRNIGYVPQSIYLCDDTITRNIAFGIADESINFDVVQTVARMANLHDFITSELSSGYETVVGERGVRLSGGQRQRIGIARALYHNPSLLVLDEATSALDGITENAVMDAIQNIAHQKTIIMIAHRLSTVKSCDRIYLFGDGKVLDQGTYDELMQDNVHFRKMARLNQ